ncbi:MAG: hypothetical protein II814_09020, partial [Treponema sp.]|nr:hypothetical protein [Treponema sp.]
MDSFKKSTRRELIYKYERTALASEASRKSARKNNVNLSTDNTSGLLVADGLEGFGFERGAA